MEVSVGAGRELSRGGCFLLQGRHKGVTEALLRHYSKKERESVTEGVTEGCTAWEAEGEGEGEGGREAGWNLERDGGAGAVPGAVDGDRTESSQCPLPPHPSMHA